MKNPPVQHQPRQGKVVRGAVKKNLLRTDRKDRLVSGFKITTCENVVIVFMCLSITDNVVIVFLCVCITDTAGWHAQQKPRTLHH